MSVEVRTPKHIEFALDEIASTFVEVHSYIDLNIFDPLVRQLQSICQAAEEAMEADQCPDCLEPKDDCICEDEDDDDSDDDEAAA